MSSIALYRYPQEGNKCHCIENDDNKLGKLDNTYTLHNSSSFLFAPFQSDNLTPAVELDATDAKTLDIDDLPEMSFNLPESNKDENSVSDERGLYATDFKIFHDALETGKYGKLVLSRSHQVKISSTPDCVQLFKKAARQNPNCFVALASTPLSGTWLTATPEILLEQKGDTFRTMALAGTQTLNFKDGITTLEKLEWDDKNRREQACVADYIRKRLHGMGVDYKESQPVSVKAGMLAHIMSDFVFSDASGNSLSPLHVASKLHPTPAVCGLPAEEARQFIMHNEHIDRQYYSGYCGTVSIQAKETKLFVTLRCMNIAKASFTLYAGGGLLPESEEESEWVETNNKMQAMLKVIENRHAQ